MAKAFCAQDKNDIKTFCHSDKFKRESRGDFDAIFIVHLETYVNN